MPTVDLITEYVIRYGFQVLGAILVFAVGALVARWAGETYPAMARASRHGATDSHAAGKNHSGVDSGVYDDGRIGQPGVQIAPLLAGIGVAGLGVGLALQGVLSNVFAGLSIIFTKPYRVGEHISLLGVEGDVLTIDLFSTTLLHPDRSRVVIPNRKIVGEILHNFSHIRQLHLAITVAYSTNLTEALTLVRSILALNPAVLKDPAPAVGITQLGDSGIMISIDPWVSVADYARVQGELNQVLVERFQSADIQIPYPQHEVRLLSAT